MSALVCNGASSVVAQAPVDKEPVAREEAHDPPGPDVYLNDSFEAADTLAKARGLAARNRWSDAAEILQRASDSAGDKLVRLSAGSYTGVRSHVSDLISAWPKAGISAYRQRFERDMETALQAVADSRGVDELLPLFERYFCTATAARLADRIAQLAIESGDFALAEHVYRRVLDHHPDAAVYASRYRNLLTVLTALRGEGVADSPLEDADAKLRWMGQERALGDVVEEIRRSFTGVIETAQASDWPLFAGAVERNRLAVCDVDEPGLLWRFRMSVPPDTQRESDAESVTQSGPRGARDLTLFPVVSGDLVFVQRSREIVALHRNTGAVAWRFGADGGSPRSRDELEDEPPGWDSVTVQEGRMYASLPGDELPFYSYESAREPCELVCLEAKSGRTIWRVGPKSFDDSGSGFSFDSGPIVRYGRVYMVGRRRRSFGFEDCYLYRLNAADGSLEHRTHLGSASTATFGPRAATRAVAAMHGDTVYVCTNLGAIAAVSAHTGVVRWLRLYTRLPADAANVSNRYTREISPAQLNPILWSGGRVVCLPTDSPNVVVLAADDGRPLHAVPVDTLGGMDIVFGVRGDLMCGVGREVGCYGLSTGTANWTATLPEGPGGAFGRGVWTNDEVAFPRREGLSRFRVADGQRIDSPWDAKGQGGNLLALPEQLIVSDGASVAAYVRKADIWKALRERMAAAPNDPLPALELAEVALGAGEYTEALAVLDEAVRRLDLSATSAENALHDRLFADVLEFLDLLFERSLLDAGVLDRLFAYASEHARSGESNLLYRRRFAGLFEKFQQPERALRLYQQILRDRSLRELAVDPHVTGSLRAATFAQSRIARLIEQHGPGIYAEYEAEATRWLESGRAAGDIAAFQRLVDTFPNSQAAPLALVAYGDQLVKLGRGEEAAGQFARAYHRFPRQVDRPALMRKTADAYEKAGKVEHAYRWLTKAAREFPTATVEHEGRSMTFQQYRERLADARARVEPSRPKGVLPLDGEFVLEFEGPVSLLTPLFEDDPSCRWSKFYVHTAASIRAFDAHSGKDLWSEPVPVATTPELLIAREDLAVFATPHEVFALETATGSRRWSYGERPKHLDDPGADWEAGGAFRAHAMLDDRLVSLRDDGRMTCVSVDTGKILWSETRRPAPAGRLRLVDPWLAYDFVQDGRAVVHLVDLATGARLEEINTDEKRSVEDLFISMDGQVIVVTSQSVSSYDAGTHTRRWHVPVGGTLRRASLLLDMDALYFVEDGGDLRKIDLDDGRLLWQSERLVRRGEDDLTLQREGGSLIISTNASITAVDTSTGLTLWQGTTPDRPRFVSRLLTQSYVIAVNVPGELRDAPSAAFFYDHRNASGLIPRNGARELGVLSDVRAALATDAGLVIQSGSTVRGYTSGK